MVTVRDRGRAEDLVAEAFTRAWERWRTVSRRPNPRAWVVRTALNLNVSRWRLERRGTPYEQVELVDWSAEPDVDPP